MACNLIMNSQWCPGSTGGPQYFSGTGPVTYDQFFVSGNRTCSVTMTENNSTASDSYDLAIPVFGQKSLVFGYIIRAISCNCCYLQVEYYNQNNQPIDILKMDITRSITADFRSQMRCFPIPCNAQYAKVSLHFNNQVTACTFCAPCAYFR